MSAETISFNAEPVADSTPIVSIVPEQRSTETFGEILADPKNREFRGETNHLAQLEKLGQLPVAMTIAEKNARRVTLIQQVYEIERDE